MPGVNGRRLGSGPGSGGSTPPPAVMNVKTIHFQPMPFIHAMGDRLMVGRRALDSVISVRVRVPQLLHEDRHERLVLT